MAAFGSAAAVLAVSSFALLRLLALSSRAHDQLTGHRPTVARHVPWLRRAPGERSHEISHDGSLSALEVILILVVFAAVVAFEIWFAFYSTSPIDQRSGRG
jgi:hypothetical protein